MFDVNFYNAVQDLTEKGETAAVAVIVRRDAPSSGKPGDRAVITAQGEVKGWIGGGCTKGIVIKEALESIQQLTPRLVRIQPGTDAPDQAGVKNYKMTCMSGGSVEVYIEPIMPVTTLRIFGRSHIAKALCTVGKAAGFRIEVVSDLAEEDMFPSADLLLPLNGFNSIETPNDFTVVCTQGEDDAGSLLAAIRTNPRYLGFVASRKKAAGIFSEMRLHNIGFDQLEKIKTPAGVDINAKTPEEVAISILAEVVALKRSTTTESPSFSIHPPEADTRTDGGGNAKSNKGTSVRVVAEGERIENRGPAQEKQSSSFAEAYYINPVCDIPVQKATAKHVLEHNGEKVYFCCDGCKTSFEADPEKYIPSIH